MLKIRQNLNNTHLLEQITTFMHKKKKKKNILHKFTF